MATHTLTITVDTDTQLAHFALEDNRFGEAFCARVLDMGADEPPDHRWMLTDDSDADPTYYASWDAAVIELVNYGRDQLLDNMGLLDSLVDEEELDAN